MSAGAMVGGGWVFDWPLLVRLLTAAGSFRLEDLTTLSGEGGDRILASSQISAGVREGVWMRLCLRGGGDYFIE